DVCRSYGRGIVRGRPLAAVAVVTAPGPRCSVAAPFGLSVVHRNCRNVGRQFLRAGHWPRYAGQGDERPGGSRRAARLLSATVLGNLLARRRVGGVSGIGCVEIASRAWRPFLASLAAAVVARVLLG